MRGAGGGEEEGDAVGFVGGVGGVVEPRFFLSQEEGAVEAGGGGMPAVKAAGDGLG